MKIRSVSCEQFAGIRNQSAEFADGLNLMIGENESGKSTLADLIYQILFQPSKQKKNSEFMKKYFPKTVDGMVADYVDGTLCFDTDEGTFKLEKEWEYAGGSSKLWQPNGVSLKTPETIDAILRGQLKFKDGVYREIIFPSQKREQWVLDTILKGLTKDTAEVRESFEATLTKAALETGGVSLGKMEAAIQEKIDNLLARWDESAGLPEGGAKRGLNNPWKNGAGEIVKAWYEKEKVQARLDDVVAAEQRIEECSKELRGLEEEKKGLRKKQEEFRKVRDRISRRNSLESLVKVRENEIREMDEAVRRWPALKKDGEEAERLGSSLSAAQIRKHYDEVKALQMSVEEKRRAFEAEPQVSDEDLAEYRRLVKEIEQCERLLSGMNVDAKIEQIGAAEVLVRSAATGEPLEKKDGHYVFDGAVEVEIPGIMRMTLSPAGVDADQMAARLVEAREAAERTESRYGVKQVNELEDKKKRREKLGWDLQSAEEKLDAALGGKSLEELEKENAAIPGDVEDVDTIQSEIRRLCGAMSLEAYLGGVRSRAETYANKYGSEEALSAELSDLRGKLQKERAEFEAVQEIPEEFRSVADPVQFDQKLTGEIDQIETRMGNLKKQQGEAENRLDGDSAEECADSLSQLEAVFEAKRTEYRRWHHIQATFLQMKQESAGNPAQDIAESFARYLKMLSDGRLSLTDMDERLNTKLSSGAYALESDYLSEGTRDTVLLAFRLAMLEHLFPEGGGLAVFDDPFTDMDPVRLSRACGLIRHFAEKNQVIFITCDEKYRELLGGDVIELQ